MRRNEFIGKLSKNLQANHISDIQEIIAEYEEHFAFKLADGYSEEEIAAKLGKPEALAEQYVTSTGSTRFSGKKVITITGLIFADIFVGMFFALLYGLAIVVGIFTLATAVIGVCLLSGLNIYSLIPPTPLWCGVLFAIAFLAISVLSAVGTIYIASYSRQLMRAYGRFHNNCIAAAAGKAMLPSVAVHPHFSPRLQRRLRSIALVSLNIFVVAFFLAGIVSALTAGALEFWHEWNWFV